MIIKNKGFTLVEIVVVMAIIAVLATLVVGAITVARNTAKRTEAISELKDIKTTMTDYLVKKDALPSCGYDGDCWTGSGAPDSAAWQGAVNTMRDAGIIDQNTATRWYTDPWDTPYVYNNDYGECNSSEAISNTSSSYFSYFRSAGPDGLSFTADDVKNNIETGPTQCRWYR